MDVLHFKAPARLGLRVPRLHLNEWLTPRLAASLMVVLCLFAGVVFYLTLVLLAALHAW
jgi:hypothetical protein